MVGCFVIFVEVYFNFVCSLFLDFVFKKRFLNYLKNVIINYVIKVVLLCFLIFCWDLRIILW